MMEVRYDAAGSRAVKAKLKKFQQVERQQARAIYRGIRAARTIAAKLLRQRSGVPSAVIKKSLAGIGTGRNLIGIKATRLPIPVERLGARVLKGRRSRGTVKVRRWLTAGSARSRTFTPAWQGGSRGRFYSRHKSDKSYRLVGQSVARVWVGILPDIQTRAREVYERTMATWFTARARG